MNAFGRKLIKDECRKISFEIFEPPKEGKKKQKTIYLQIGNCFRFALTHFVGQQIAWKWKC